MKIASVLVLLAISAIVIGSIGCNEMMDMTKPVITPEPEPPITEVPEPEAPEEPEPPIVEIPEPEVPEEPEPPTVEIPEPEVPEDPEPLTEEEARHKAVKIARETIGFMEIHEGVPQYRFGESISEGAENILIENTGLTWEQLRGYILLCVEERGETEHIEKNRRFIAYTDILVHYLELSFLHPREEHDKWKNESLLIRRCEEREILVGAIAVISKYYPPDHVDDLLEDWNEFLREDPPEDEEEDDAIPIDQADE